MKNQITFTFPLLFALLQISHGSFPLKEPANPCGTDGWVHFPTGGKCMKLFAARTGWNVAEINCGFHGGHHVTVRDVHENQFVADLARTAGNPIWLGAAQFGQSRDYVWVDGSPFGFEHWQNNSRPSFHRGKKCVKLDGTKGDWVQSCCRVPAASICQRPAPAKLAPIQEDLSALAKDERDQLLRH